MISEGGEEAENKEEREREREGESGTSRVKTIYADNKSNSVKDNDDLQKLMEKVKQNSQTEP